MAQNGTAEQVITYQNSVKKDDYAKGGITFVYPSYGYDGYTGARTALPQNLPAHNRYAFYSDMDWTLMRTPRHEGMWADAVYTAISKAAAWGWETSGAVPLRRKRLQELLLYSTAGVFVGYVPFITAHLRGYLLTGKGVFEIERETSAYSSRIKALHHLNPMRVRFTDNPEEPVEYMDRNGRVHRLRYHEVIMMGDQTDPTEGDLGTVESAAMRAYDRIKTMEAIHTYLYEKVTGARPLEIEFIQGVSDDNIRDAIRSSDSDLSRGGSIMYKGKMLVPIMGDLPINRVTIPVSSVPDSFNYQEIHDNTAVIYAASIGMDVNDIDPRLGQRAGIGSGAQSVVLEMKARGKGLAAWREDFIQQIHRLVADAGTTFAFSENYVDDEIKRAQLAQTRANTRKQMLENGEITQQQAQNMAADVGDIPKEFLQVDDTQTGIDESDDNPNEGPTPKAEAVETAVSPKPEPEPAETKKELRDDVLKLIRDEARAAVRLSGVTAEDDDTAVTSDTSKELSDALTEWALLRFLERNTRRKSDTAVKD